VAEGGDDGVAAVHLGDMAVQRAQRHLLLHEELLRALGDARDDHDAERQRQDDDQRQDPADREHHDDDADQRQRRRQQLGEVLLAASS
jgi:hypothetical protein